MSKFSDLYPLTGGGGSANIAGFTWQEKTADFTAESNQAYYCDTALGDILMTLPSNPSPGDEVAFLIIGANALNITTTDNIKSAPLVTDFVKTISENYLMVIWSYVDETVGWDWDARYNSHITNLYTGAGLSFWVFEFNGSLSELQFDTGDGIAKTFTVNNGVTSFSALSNVANNTPNFAALSDGTLGTTNNQYVGRTAGTTYCSVKAVFSPPVNISKLYFYGQGSGSTLFNIPGTLRIKASADDISYSLLKEHQVTTTGLAISSTTFAAQGLTQNVLAEIVVSA